jgi:outer membrane protein
MKRQSLLVSAAWVSSLLAVPAAHAQSAAERQAQQPIPSASNFFGIGVGAFPKTSGSTGLRAMVLPVIQYTWGDIAYITGLKAGVWGYTSDDRSLRVGLYAEPRFGFDASDNTRTLGMADRDFAIDAGPSVRWTTPVGVVNFDYGFDVTRKSSGQVAQLQFIRPLVAERGFRVNGLVGVTWQSAAMNNYYWGVSGSETASGRPAYNAGAGTALSIGISGLYAFGPSGAMFYGATLNRLSDAQADSPIAERRYTPVIYLGYGWRL